MPRGSGAARDNSMSSLREQAEYLRISLLMGLIGVADVVRWADAAIGNMTEPPSEIIDLALAGKLHPEDVARMLAQVQGDADLTLAAHRAVGELASRFSGGSITIDDVAGMLYSYSQFARVDEIERGTASILEDVLEYYTIEGATHAITEFLTKYGQVPEAIPLHMD
jgi:hypothetical protein